MIVTTLCDRKQNSMLLAHYNSYFAPQVRLVGGLAKPCTVVSDSVPELYVWKLGRAVLLCMIV